MKSVSLLMLLLIGCCTVSPVKDFPSIPLPEATVLEPVSAVKKEGGFWLSETEYAKVVHIIQGLKFETEILRKIIVAYNEWALERKK